jgi:uncharacterized protein with von Willebrand factor type A (vWA) domain
MLRLEHGFLAGPGELRDAARALTIVGVGDERTVRDALRAVLVSRPEEIPLFERVFTAFFLSPPPEGIAQADQPSFDTARGAAPRGVLRPESAPAAAEDGDESPAAARGESDQREVDGLGVGRAWSPHAGTHGASFIIARDPTWDAAAKFFVRRLHVGLSRRWRPGLRGRRFDPRRTLRRSLQTGGEVLTPRWLHRRRRAPRLVVVIDGSRSMDRHARTALDMAVSLATATPRLEVFTFSTALRQVTRAVRGVAMGRAPRVEPVGDAWGGGTRIGASLLRVLVRLERRPGPRNTVLLIVSDGLDIGEPLVLREAMAGLARRAAAVIWLNPLIASAGYEPIAEGMRIARPYVGAFSNVATPRDLVRLARRVHLRR